MYQHMPKEWEGKDEDRLAELVYKHTREVLEQLGLSYYPYWYGRIGNGKEMPEEALRPEALRPDFRR